MKKRANRNFVLSLLRVIYFLIVRRDIRKKWYDDSGVLNVSLTEFLLNDDII